MDLHPFQITEHPSIPSQPVTPTHGAAVRWFVVHRSPIGARLLVRRTHKRSNLNREIGGAARI